MNITMQREAHRENNFKSRASALKVGCKPQLEARMTITSTITSTMTMLFYFGQKSQQVRYEKFCVFVLSLSVINRAPTSPTL